MSQKAADAPDAHKMLKVVVGGEAASLNSPEAKEKNGPQGPVLQIVLKFVVRADMPRRLRLPRQSRFRP